MSISIVNSIAESLAEYMVQQGIVGGDNFDAVYPNDTTPATELPDAYLEVLGNGPLSTNMSQCGVKSYALVLVVNIRLRSNGSVNTVRETYLLDLVDDFFKDVLILGEFHYSIDKYNMVYSGKDLTSGYSTKMVNINVKIY